MFPKKVIVIILIAFFLAATFGYIYIKNFYVPGTIVFLRNDGIYLYQNFGQPKKLVNLDNLLSYPGVSVKLSPDGKHFFFAYNKNREGTSYYDILVYNIYDMKTGKVIPLESNDYYFGIGIDWAKDSSKLFVETSNKVQVFALNGKLVTVLNNDDPTIKQQEYITPIFENWDKYKSSSLTLRPYYPDRAIISPDSTKALLDVESDPHEAYNRSKRDIYILDLQSGKVRFLIKNGSFPSWSN